MHSQGDKERDAGNEVQAMYDRAKADKPNAQIVFVDTSIGLPAALLIVDEATLVSETCIAV